MLYCCFQVEMDLGDRTTVSLGGHPFLLQGKRVINGTDGSVGVPSEDHPPRVRHRDRGERSLVSRDFPQDLWTQPARPLDVLLMKDESSLWWKVCRLRCSSSPDSLGFPSGSCLIPQPEWSSSLKRRQHLCSCRTSARTQTHVCPFACSTHTRRRPARMTPAGRRRGSTQHRAPANRGVHHQTSGGTTLRPSVPSHCGPSG